MINEVASLSSCKASLNMTCCHHSQKLYAVWCGGVIRKRKYALLQFCGSIYQGLNNNWLVQIKFYK